MTQTPTPDQRLDSVEQRLDSMESRLDRLEGEFREQGAFLLEGLRALSAQTTNLANRVDRLTEVTIQLAQNADSDRAEIRRIWEYLIGQQRNGNGNREQ